MNKIETVVQDMMEKLGVGGFMGIQDVKPQMHCVLVRKGETREEYHGKVVRQSGSELWLQICLLYTSYQRRIFRANSADRRKDSESSTGVCGQCI